MKIQQGPVTAFTNHEGYKDVTANAAIANAMGSRIKYQRGDITYFTDRGGLDRTVVLLAVFDDFGIALELRDEESAERDYKVLVRTVMHADLGKIINVYFNKLHDVIKTMPDEALDNLITAVGRMLGCTPEPEIREVVKEVPKEVVKEVVKEVPAAVDNEAVEMGKEQLIRAETERDLYKGLYENMLNRLLGATG